MTTLPTRTEVLPTYRRMVVRELSRVSLVENGAQWPHCRIAHVDPHTGIVFGWCFVSTVDGEPFVADNGRAKDESNLIALAAAYLANGGGVDENHAHEVIGEAVFAFPMTRELAAKVPGITATQSGLLVGVRVGSDVLAKVQSGELQGFSILTHGRSEPAGLKPHMVIDFQAMSRRWLGITWRQLRESGLNFGDAVDVETDGGIVRGTLTLEGGHPMVFCDAEPPGLTVRVLRKR